MSDSADAYLDLLRVHERLSGEFTTLFRAYRLSQASYNVLRILRGARPEPLGCGEIAARTVTRVPDITRLVDRLGARSLVARERGESDRRVVLIRITDKGLALLKELDEPVERLHEKLLGHLSAAELQQFRRGLARVLARPGDS